MKIKEEAKTRFSIIACCVVATITNLFFSTFFNAELFKVTVDNKILVVALYNLVSYVSIFVFFFLFSFITKRTSRLWFFRISVFLKCVIFFAYFFFSEIAHISINNSYLIFAFCFGAASGLYYNCFNNLITEEVKPEKMQSFYAKFIMASVAVSIIVPALLGSIINSLTFGITSVFVFVFGLVEILFSFLITSEFGGSKMQLRKFIKTLKEPKYKFLKTVYICAFLEGIVNTIPICSVIITISLYGNSLVLGIVGTIFTAVAVLAVFLFDILKWKNKNILLIIFGIIPLITAIICFFTPNIILLVMNGIYILFFQIINLINGKRKFGLIRDFSLDLFIAEHHDVAEFFLFIGRALAFGLLSILGILLEIDLAIRVFLVCAVIAIPIMGILLFKLEKKLEKNDDFIQLTENRLQNELVVNVANKE